MNVVRLLCLTCCLLLCSCAGQHNELAAWWPREHPLPPVYAGQSQAPQSILIYTNPQCPACRTSWPLIPELRAALDPQTTRLHILGRGFTPEGTRLMFLASLLAAEDPALGLDFLSDVMSRPESLEYTSWSGEWLAARAGRFDEERLRLRAESLREAQSYLQTVMLVRDHYGLTHTPSLVVNGRIYQGPRTVEGLLGALGN